MIVWISKTLCDPLYFRRISHKFVLMRRSRHVICTQITKCCFIVLSHIVALHNRWYNDVCDVLLIYLLWDCWHGTSARADILFLKPPPLFRTRFCMYNDQIWSPNVYTYVWFLLEKEQRNNNFQLTFLYFFSSFCIFFRTKC